MSKERLEEIENKVIKNTVAITNKNTNKINFGHSYTLLDVDYKWLIEQAKRVQELEKAIADYAYEIGKRKRALNKKNEQNKRYREVFGHMRRIILHPFSKTINKHETLYKIETILRELEGED